jgi:hypothetical protein
VWGGFLDVFALRDRLVEDYESYVGSFVKIKDARIEDELVQPGCLFEQQWSSATYSSTHNSTGSPSNGLLEAMRD